MDLQCAGYAEGGGEEGEEGAGDGGGEEAWEEGCVVYVDGVVSMN